jgi:hypothetical protein
MGCESLSLKKLDFNWGYLLCRLVCIGEMGLLLYHLGCRGCLGKSIPNIVRVGLLLFPLGLIL